VNLPFVRRVLTAICASSLVALSGCGSEAGDGDASPQLTSSANAEPAHLEDCAGKAWCPAMIGLPGGTAVLGSLESEPGRFDDEDRKTVQIKPFAIGEFPVTRAQWAAFVAATARPIPKAPCAYAPSSAPSWKDPGFQQTDKDPVVCVSWDDAQDYARWLSEQTGEHYRLPSDDEWEYAARAGSTSAFPWGPTASHAFANYGLNECCGPATEGRDRWEYTSPVGSFPPNAFGLHDMHGNVFEWVETCADSFEKLPLRSDGKGCTYRYARGGVYADRPEVMRSAAKNLAPPPGDKMTIETYRSAGFGFRVAKDI
jgi:formylglycine-generating enzyme required for sulfatase activity